MLLFVESEYGNVQINNINERITYEDIGYACHLCSKDDTRVFTLWTDGMITKIGSYSATMKGVYELTCKIAELQ